MRGVLGRRVEKGLEVKRAGGAGFMLGNSPSIGNEVTVDAHLLPPTSVASSQAIRIRNYIQNSTNPTASLAPGHTVLRVTPAPFMAAFTSRGSNVIDPNILKGSNGVKFNMASGTSMACPHVAATAALLKALHPRWSSAAIRSAIITTAWKKNNEGKPITDQHSRVANPFQFGSGHFRPTKAANPGLVYDATYKDYVDYLYNFGMNYLNNSKIKCPKIKTPTYNLNYPSVSINEFNGSAVTVPRSVTNVGPKNSTYFFSSKPPSGFSVEASPSVLYFDRIGKKMSFVVRIKAKDFNEAKRIYKDDFAFGWYTLSDKYYIVRSPIAISLA